MNCARAAQLEKIAQEVRDLEESPLYDYRKENGYSPVIGEGDLFADIMFIGEAPGAAEAKTGRPFVGRAGRVLDELLESIDINRDDVYITNVVNDRPPRNRDPRVAEIELYAPFLLRQIRIIRPSIIATLGRFAMRFTLERFGLPGTRRRIGELHGQVLHAQAPYGEVSIVPLYHPAATFYNRGLEKSLREDFQVLKRFT